MIVMLVGALQDQLVKFVDQDVDLFIHNSWGCYLCAYLILEDFEPLLVLVSELVGALLDEGVHVLDRAEVGRVDLAVNHFHVVGRLRLFWLRKVLTLADLEGALPVFAVHRDHEVLEVVHGVHVGWHVLFAQGFGGDASKVEVFGHEFIKCLLFKYEVVHF